MTLYEVKMRLKRNPLIKKTYDLLKKSGSRKAERARRAALQRDGVLTAQQVEAALTGQDVVFFANYGSLLGLVRDGKFMDYDDDIDYGIFIDDKFGWSDLERVLSEQGFVKIKQFTYLGRLTEQTYQKQNLSVDFFGCYLDDTGLRSYLYQRQDGFLYHSSREYHVSCQKMYPISGVKTLRVGNDTYHVPNEAEEYLASIYGENWKIPDPCWTDQMSPAWNPIQGALGEVTYFPPYPGR